MSVVIVDDSADFLAAATRFVGELPGVRVVGTAASGAAAIETVERTSPQVLLLDFTLPDMNGLEVARRLAGRPGLPHIVLVTLFASEEMARAARLAGIEHVVPKESFAAELPQLLDRLLPRA